MGLLRYVSHPEVDQDPTVPVPRWRLSDRGRERAGMMLDQPWLTSIGRVVSSDETKAMEAAHIVAGHLGLQVEVRAASGEVDRSATGFIDRVRHDELADRLFAAPARSADGWERAVDAQDRLAEALADLLTPRGGTAAADGDTASGQPDSAADVMVVGHGGVGTLLYCHLAGLEIDRRHDQPGQGHYWSYDRESGAVINSWRPIDAIE